jgi:hypothetical protein
MDISIADLVHPYYEERLLDWTLWRDVYAGGRAFINSYLKRYSSRESNPDFENRKTLSYNPAFAKQAVDETKNSIFQRLVDISRKGGSRSYEDAVAGRSGGVDLLGSSMNAYIGRVILPELLTMSRVGVYVDMPPVSALTKAEEYGRPYIYIYCAEDIRSWVLDDESENNEFAHILLRERVNVFHEKTGLPNGTTERYRRMWLADGCVMCQFYDEKGDDKSGEFELPFKRIPFVLVEISDSLLSDVARYQVALMNLCSADMAYAISANFPFYVEQFEPRASAEFTRKPGAAQGGEGSDAAAAKTDEMRVGYSKGRKYPKGMERPAFIHPSPEPLEASMKKQEQMKQEIRQLVNLSVTNLTPKMASAESKGMDRQGLESGLSYIGLELERMEGRIAEYWAMYEGNSPATIIYPTSYSVLSDDERRKEADDLKELLPTIPSQTYQRTVQKRIAELTIARQTDAETLERINSEIEASKALTADPEVIAKSVEIGALDLKLASGLLGYPEGTAERAADDHAKRLERIAKSQAENNGMQNGAARGVDDLGDGSNSDTKGEQKKGKDTTADDVVKKKQRGEGKNLNKES